MEYTKKSDGQTRWIDCYNSSQKILLVGEGDFSFSACLARAFHTAKNIIATSYLDEDSLVEKHWTCIPHLEELKQLGCVLLSEVDVYNMDTHPILKKTKFDIVIFNFPHAGHYDYLSESNINLIKMHRELVGGFFRRASKMLSEGGQVHIRHRDEFPYDKWGVVSLGGEVGLKLKEKVLFDKSLYHGYHHKRGGDINTNKTFPIGYAFTFKFVLGLPKVDFNDHHSKMDQGYVLELRDDAIDVLEMKNLVEEHMKDDVDFVVQMLGGLSVVGDDKDGDVDKKVGDMDQDGDAKEDEKKNDNEDEEDYRWDYYNYGGYCDYDYDNPW